MSTLQIMTVQEAKPKKSLASLSVINALAEYQISCEHRLSKITLRNRAYVGKRLSDFFGNKPLGRLTVDNLIAYQKHRLTLGRKQLTINMELALLQSLLRRADLWHRFRLFRPLPLTTPSCARALQSAEIERLYAFANRAPLRSRAGADALILALSTGMRSAEIRFLRWENVSFAHRTLSIRRSKTPAGWRTLALNDTALHVLEDRLTAAVPRGFADPLHFVFPFNHVDPTKPTGSFYSSWDTIRKQAGISARFHDARHTAITMLAESGVPEAVIRAQVGHASQEMLALYTHPRSEAMRQASQLLDYKPPLPTTKEESQNENLSPVKTR